MATLRFKFTTKGPGSLRNKVTLQCTVKGSSNRHYMLVEEFIESFSIDAWNEDRGKFIDGDNAVYNNSILSELLDDSSGLNVPPKTGTNVPPVAE